MRGEEPEVHLKRCKEDIFISPVSIPDAKTQHFWAIQIPAHLAAEAPDVPRQGTHPHGAAHPLLVSSAVSSASKHAWFKEDSLPNRSRSFATSEYSSPFPLTSTNSLLKYKFISRPYI